MPNNTVNFTINIGGNAITGIAQIDEAMGSLLINAKKSVPVFDKIASSVFKFNQITDAVRNFNEMLSNTIQPGVNFDYSLRELSAIAQVTGGDLDEIGRKARNLAKVFGGDAAQYVESFKDVIGSLGDSFADQTALEMMGKNIATLSKLMGGDAKAAANALTTAMLQYGVDLSDPIAASEEAARMMNVMQAAANVGASEVSDTAEALRQSGLLAQQSGVSFEELNASLEALAKGKVVAGEAGTAMRNMLLSMNTLTDMPQETAAALKAYGVDVAKVADPTVKFTDRLRELKKIQGDAVLMESVFMKANIASGSVILGNIDVIDEYTEAITGTQAATEGAAIVMESFQEKQARIEAKFNDIQISIFNATGDMGLWASTVASSLIPVSQLIPLITGLWSAIGTSTAFIKDNSKALRKNTTAFWGNITSQGTFMAISLTTAAVMGVVTGAATAMWAAITGPVGLIVAAVAAVIAVFIILWQKCEGLRKIVFGVWEAIKAMFYNIWVVIKAIFELIWSGIIKPYINLWKNIFLTIWEAVKLVFNSIVSVIQIAFDWIKTAVVAVADFFVSVWGWIVEAVSSAWDWIIEKLGFVGTWIKEKLIEPIKNAFSAVWDFISGIFDKILNKLGKLFAPIKELWNKLFPKDKFKDVSVAYSVGTKKGEESWQKAQEKKNQKQSVVSLSADTSVLGENKGDTGNASQTKPIIPVSMGASAGSSAGQIKNINITIDKVVESFTVSTTTIKESTKQIKDIVAQAIIEACNDVNLAF